MKKLTRPVMDSEFTVYMVGTPRLELGTSSLSGKLSP